MVEKGISILAGVIGAAIIARLFVGPVLRKWGYDTSKADGVIDKVLGPFFGG